MILRYRAAKMPHFFRGAKFLIRPRFQKKIPRAPMGNVGVSMSAAPGAERGSVAEIVSFLPLFTEDRRWAESQPGRLAPRGKGKGLGVCQHTSIPVYIHQPWIPDDQQTARNHIAVGKLTFLLFNTTLHTTLAADGP